MGSLGKPVGFSHGGVMNSEIVINASHRETRVALLENGQVAELYVERKRNASLVGNIFKGIPINKPFCGFLN